MKKLFIVLCFLLFAVGAYAESDEIYCKDIFNGTIAASGTETLPELQLIRKAGFTGFFCVQPSFTGTGVLKISYQTSCLGKIWSPAVEITASATSASEYRFPENGVNMFSGFVRITLEETGTSSNVDITEFAQCAQ